MHFDASCTPEGPFLIGEPKEVAEKASYLDEVLGGIDRLNLQMTNVMVNHEHMLESISLLGTEVAPRVREQNVVT